MWYKTLGFSRYPLDPRSNARLIGVDDVQDKVEHYIEQGNMCLLCGFTGSGKTSMLKRLMLSKKLNESKLDLVYISADTVRKDDTLDSIIGRRRSIWSWITNPKKKNMVILLDECHLAPRSLTESIKGTWNIEYDDGSKAIQSVVLAQIENRLGSNFSGSFQDRLGKRVVVMPKLPKDLLENVLKARLDNGTRNYFDSFEMDAMKVLMDSSDGSVRQLLEYTDAIFSGLDKIKEGNPLLDEKYAITKETVLNFMPTAELVSTDRMGKKESLQKIFSNAKLKEAADLFHQHGALSAVNLAEKLDIKHDAAKKIVADLEHAGGVVFAHTDDGRDFYVLTPRLQHELTRT